MKKTLVIALVIGVASPAMAQATFSPAGSGIAELSNPDNGYLLGRDWTEPRPGKTLVIRDQNGHVVKMVPVTDVKGFCRRHRNVKGC